MRETTRPQQFVSIICKPLEYGHFCIESMWSHNKAGNHRMWNSTMTTEERQSITALRFCISEHPAAQHDFSWCHQSSHNLPLYSASYWNEAVTNPATRGENDHHRWTAPRTDTNQRRRRVAHDMAKGIQISRVTSANTTHSTKISAVNSKQLSSNIIDPLFLW
jgi:hypothetical protein